RPLRSTADPGLNVSDISESDRVGSCVDALLQPPQVGLEGSERPTLCVRAVLSIFVAAWPSDFDVHRCRAFACRAVPFAHQRWPLVKCKSGRLSAAFRRQMRSRIRRATAAGEKRLRPKEIERRASLQLRAGRAMLHRCEPRSAPCSAALGSCFGGLLSPRRGFVPDSAHNLPLGLLSSLMWGITHETRSGSRWQRKGLRAVVHLDTKAGLWRLLGHFGFWMRW